MEINSYNNHFRKRYQILNFIARGAFGNVYKVKDIKEQVIKTEKISINRINPKYKQKFVQQLQLMIKLNNKMIIKGYEYIIQQKINQIDKELKSQYMHMIMEHFEGKQLEDYLGKLTQGQVIKIYKQLKSAILYLQNQKIVHRDIILDNILVDENMNIKITNFGISSNLKGEKYQKTSNEQGKDSYRSHQVWNNNISMNSDLWALGIIVLELYFGDRISKLYKSKPEDGEDFPSELYEMKKEQMPIEIMRIVEPLLEKDHNKRKFYEEDEQDDNDKNEDRVMIFKHIKTDHKITRKMTQLNLISNNITTEAAVEISKNLKNLTSLYLGNNKIGTLGAMEIAKNLTNLTQLSLYHNNIEKEGASEIAKNLKKLIVLSLNNNKIGTEGAVEIANNLKNLMVLSLNYNNIGTEGAVEIAKNLKNLIALSLINNEIDEQGKKAIRSLMKDTHVSA